MFNDKYGLTQAVLEGRKTQTRRIAYTAGRWRDIMVGQYALAAVGHRVCLEEVLHTAVASVYKVGAHDIVPELNKTL